MMNRILVAMGLLSIALVPAAAADTAKLCVSEIRDVTLYSGGCGDEHAWVQLEIVRSGITVCANTLLDLNDPGTCEDNQAVAAL